jgi:serine/threonine-protein kinase
MADVAGFEQRFVILGALGKGGMGTVYRARNRQTGELVAIKQLHAMFVDDPDYVARFEREVEVAQRITSPNVVRVLGYGKHDGAPYMVMEYVEGQSLRDLLNERHRLTWEEAKPILTQVAEGLRAAHRVGVIHRDVKPSNILITPDGTVKLADFGIARATDLTRLTGGATMLGTPAYMAPENSPSPQSDLYALGVVLYEMVSGRPPFTGETQQEVLLKHLRERPDINEVPLPARRIVSALLQKTPQRRPQSATALLMLLESDPSTPSGPVTPTVKADGGGGASNNKPLIGAGIAVVAIVALAVLFIAGPFGGGGDSKASDDPTPTAASTSSSSGTSSSGNGVSERTATPTATPAQGSTPTPTPTRSATQPPTPPSTGPRVNSKDWSPQNARWGDTIDISLDYTVGDAPIKQVQFHETGVNRSGGPINWGSISGPDGVDYQWSGDNYMLLPWQANANEDYTFTLTLNCRSGYNFSSRFAVVFIDTKNRRTQEDLVMTMICSSNGR